MLRRKVQRRLVAGTAGLLAMMSSLGVAQAASLSTWIVKPGDTLWSIAQANHVTVSALEAANPAVQPQNLKTGSAVQVPEAPAIGAPDTTTAVYTVKTGDTFWNLAQRFNVSVQQLITTNPSLNPTNLIPGTVVVLPQAGASTTPPSSGTSPSNTSPLSAGASSTTATSTNLYWLAHVIHAEANGLSQQAQIAVGDVVMHRVQSPYYPNTVQGVVFQIINGHYQFTCVANGYIYSQPNTSAYQAASQVLQQHDDVVPGALVFFNPAQTAASSWVWQQPRVSTIGPFIFAE